ncbi:MAG: alternative ribosome rescue aminoacyl-tRNA hydrolase ArfB [Anaerolineae bacterium]
MADEIIITPNIIIPRSDLNFRFARSGGPGGQHVNTADTKAILSFDVANSAVLKNGMSEAKFGRVLARLENRLDSEGVLQITCQETRSQLSNKEIAIERLKGILQGALIEPKKRKKTRPSQAAKERRLKAKKIRSDRKKGRSGQWE